jgi:Protein of unknown function (DUF4019)
MRKTTARRIAGIGALLVALGSVPSTGAEEAEDLAVEAALRWLAEVDAGDYGASWDHAAELFKKAVSREDWETAVSGTRGPLGELVSRDLQSTTYTSELPGAPDGEYVVIQFKTSFAKKKNAVETVTPMKDPDGKWRVSGYYIR